MTPDDDKTAFTPRRETAFPQTAAVGKTELVTPPTMQRTEMGNSLPVGTRIEEFEITSVLGEGGFGIVYLADDHSLGRRVALKEYMPSSLAARTVDSQVQVRSERHRETFEAGRKSFVNEARLLAQFDHPSLVKVYRFWEANGTAYMVMPFYEGKNLRDTLREMRQRTGQPPDEAWLRTLLLPLTEALLVIHAEQCYHRDIAPDNVMMLAGSQRPLLLDFGAARRVIGDMTQALTVILKPGYAPIEQYAEVPGMKQGPWTDVYALAAVVYFSIVGKTPPVSVGRMLNDSYEPLAEAAAGRYSQRFLAAVDRALIVRPEQRTPSIDAFRADLGLVPGAPAETSDATAIRTRVQAPPPGPAPKPPVIRIDDDETRIVTRRGAPPAPPASAEPGRQQGLTAAVDGSTVAVRKGPPVAAIGIGAVVLGAAAVGGYLWMSRQPASAPAVAAAPVAAPAPAPSAATVAPSPAPAPAPVAPAPFEPASELDRVAQAQTPGFTVRAEPEKTQLSVAGKDEIKFRVTSERDGFLYVLGLGSDGTFALLLPNKLSGPVRVQKGRPFAFPRKDGFYLPAAEPLGATRLLAIVSSEPRDFAALKPKEQDPILLLPTGAEATALAAQYKGTQPLLAGEVRCAAGASACSGDYGATLLRYETVR